MTEGLGSFPYRIHRMQWISLICVGLFAQQLVIALTGYKMTYVSLSSLARGGASLDGLS